MSRSSRRSALKAFALGLALLAGGANAATFEFQVIAYSGGPVPGVPGAVFAQLSYPSQSSETYPTLSSRGAVSFRGQLAVGPGGVTANDDGGIWGPGPDGALSLLVREGQLVSGTPPAACVYLYPPLAVRPGLLLLNARDQLVFGCVFRPPDATSGGGLGLAGPLGGSSAAIFAIEGSPLSEETNPYVAGPVDLLGGPVLDDLGRVTFMAYIHTVFGTLEGLWRTSSEGAVEPLVLSGDAAPGIPNMHISVPGAPSTSRNGDLAFSSTVRGSGLEQREGVWVSDEAGGWLLVLRTGEAAAGAPGATYQDVDRPDVNVQRQTAFAVSLGPLADCDTLGGPCDAVYRADPSGTEALIVRTGVAVEGTDPGAVFATSDPEVLINDFGMVAFKGTVFVPGAAGLEEKGAVFGPGGFGVRVHARVGAQAPGLPAGILYERLERPLLNNRGEVVFWAQLEPAAPFTLTKGGIFFANASGVVQPVLRSGDWIEVGGVSREISQITTWSPSNNGSRRPFDDAGEFAFSVRFTGGGDAHLIGRVRRPPPACGLGAEIAIALSASSFRSARARRARTGVASRTA